MEIDHLVIMIQKKNQTTDMILCACSKNDLLSEAISLR